MIKTGTITSGEFKVHSVETVGSHVSSSQLLSMAAAIEAVSTHPIATSIVSEAKDQGLTVEPSDFVQELAGEGMVGMTDGQQVLIGNRRLMERYNVQGYPTEAAEYGTEVLVAEGNTYLGRIISPMKLAQTLLKRLLILMVKILKLLCLQVMLKQVQITLLKKLA